MSCQNNVLPDIKFIPMGNPAAASHKLDAEDYQCGICSASFNSKSNLLEHVELKHRRNQKSREDQQEHSEIRLKSCPDCAAKFRNDFDLYKHRRDGCHRHQEEEQDEAKSVPQENQSQLRNFSCSKCNQNFKFRIQLVKHGKLHDEYPPAAASDPDPDSAQEEKEPAVEKSKSRKAKSPGQGKCYSCPKSFCNYRSKFPSNVKVNLKRRHREGTEGGFKCDLCPFRTALKWNLKQHRSSHSLEKSFVCAFPNCDYRSHWAGNLKTNQARVHGGRSNLKKALVKRGSAKWVAETSPNFKKEKAKANVEKLLETPRTSSSRQRSQVYPLLCEELLTNATSSQVSQDPQVQACTPEMAQISGDSPFLAHSSDPETTSSEAILLTSNEPKELEINDEQQRLQRASPHLDAPHMHIPRLAMSSSVSSDLAGTRISELSVISSQVGNPTDQETESNESPAASASKCPQKKCKKLKKFTTDSSRKIKRLQPNHARNVSAGNVRAGGLKRKCTPSAGSFQCPHCPYRTKTQWLMRGHLVGHGAAEPFYCPMANCNFQSKWQTYFSLHMRKVHSTRYVPPGSKRKLKRLKTPAKFSGGKQPEKLGTNMDPPPPPLVKRDPSTGKRHTVAQQQAAKDDLPPPKPRKDPKSKLFLCPVPDCGFKTRYEFNMPRHVKLHQKSGSFTYTCPNCGGRLANAGALGWHKRSCPAQKSTPAPRASSNSAPKSSGVEVSRLIIVKQASPVNHNAKLYTCAVADCKYKTRFRGSFLRHQEYHRKYGIFAHICANCQNKFPTAPALLIHSHTCPAKIPANQTGKKMSNRVLESSQSEHQKGRSYTCAVPDCNYTTHLTASWLFHSKSHLKYGKFVYNCTGCQRKFPTRAALSRHGAGIPPSQNSRTSSGSSPEKFTQVQQLTGTWFTCVFPDCNFKTRFPGHMWHHKRSHQKYGSFLHTCTDCQRKFATPGALRTHGLKCTKASANCSSLTSHQKVRPRQCRKNLGQPSLTQPVVRTPEGAQETGSPVQKPLFLELKKGSGRSFQCAHGSCTFRAQTFKNLRIHQGMAHGISAKFKPNLLQSRVEPQTTIVHESPTLLQATAVNSRLLKCPDCSYKTKKKSYLNRHSVIHSAKAPFACPYCPYAARYSWNLKTHQRRRHPNKPPLLRMPTKLTGNRSCASNASTDDSVGDMSSLTAHAPEKLYQDSSRSSSASNSCNFCSYLSRLAKYLTKHMTTKCPGCHKSTDQNPAPEQVPSSTSSPPAPEVPPQIGPAPSAQAPNFACMLCGYIAQSESHALDHSRLHKTAIVALDRLSIPLGT